MTNQTWNRGRARACTAGLVAVLTIGYGCADSPAGPGRTPSSLQITSIEPNEGYAGGQTAVRIQGSGFEPGVILTLGGARAAVVSSTDTVVVARTTHHAAGLVDLIVSNPDGQSRTLANAYTYALDPGIPPPTVTSITPTVGSVDGGTGMTITGTGFRSDSSVTVGGGRLPVMWVTATLIMLNTVPHAAGPVDVVVTSLDGQSATVPGGFQFADPASFDLNGQWEGRAGGHWDFAFSFTIQNDRVVVVTCDDAPALPSGATSTLMDGKISVVEGPLRMSGRFTTPAHASGFINVPHCPDTNWEASKVIPSAR